MLKESLGDEHFKKLRKQNAMASAAMKSKSPEAETQESKHDGQESPFTEDGKKAEKKPEPKDKSTIIKKSSGERRPYEDYVPEPASSGGDIMLNFDEAELSEVIRTFAGILDINYTLDAEASGTVSIHTTRGLKKDDIFPVFFQILESNGLTAVRDGNYYKIIEAKDVSRLPLRFNSGKSYKDLPRDERFSVQIIPLKHIAASEMAKIIEPFITENGTMIPHEKSNLLLLIEKNSIIRKANYLVEMFDVDTLTNSAFRFYKLKYSTPEEMAKLLTELVSAFGGGKNDSIKFMPIPRLSTLIAISNDPDTLNWLDKMITEFDAPGEDGESRIFVYFVKNGSSEDLGQILNSVFGGAAAPASGDKSTMPSLTAGSANSLTSGVNTSSGQQPSVSSSTPLSPGMITGNNQSSPQSPFASSSGQASGDKTKGMNTTLKGPVKITPDLVRNALIIEAMPSDYRVIAGILKLLDILPRQVLIEVTIADISLDHKDEMGVEWTYKAGTDSPESSLLEAVVGSSGMKFVVGEKDRWNATLSALASKNKAKILSAPSVLASDNKEAKIDISDDIPVVSTEYTAPTTGNTPVFQTNVQYRKTGIVLSVTPHINENGLVSMKLNQEVSDVGDGVQAAGKTYTSFKKRQVTTDLTVSNNQTIVIGGLMREVRDKGDAGVPILSSIPVLGFLFGKQKDTVSKSELVLLITPRVINSFEDVNKATDDLRKKIEAVFGKE